jgi:hypothetical protein
MECYSIRVSELRNWPGTVTTERLRRAAASGIRVVDVVNRGRPVCHLALAEDMLAEWRATEPATVPLSELKRAEVSVSGLRREGRALYLSQRSGPTLALWPVEGSYARSSDPSLAEEVEALRSEVNELRREVERLKRLRRGLAAFGTLMAKTFGAELEAAKKEDAGPEGDA